MSEVHSKWLWSECPVKEDYSEERNQASDMSCLGPWGLIPAVKVTSQSQDTHTHTWPWDEHTNPRRNEAIWNLVVMGGCWHHTTTYVIIYIYNYPWHIFHMSSEKQATLLRSGVVWVGKGIFETALKLYEGLNYKTIKLAPVWRSFPPCQLPITQTQLQAGVGVRGAGWQTECDRPTQPSQDRGSRLQQDWRQGQPRWHRQATRFFTFSTLIQALHIPAAMWWRRGRGFP